MMDRAVATFRASDENYKNILDRIQDECCMQADQQILMSKTRPDRSLGKHRSLRISQAMVVEEAPSSFPQNTGRRLETGHCRQPDHASKKCDIAAVKI
jgi:hypothetical protein